MIAIDEIILVSSGEYSAYGIIVLCKALKTFDENEAREKYLQSIGGPQERYVAEEKEFGTWLIENGYLTKIHFRELYLGDYGEFAEKDRKPLSVEEL